MEDFFSNQWVLTFVFAAACYVLTVLTRKVVENAAPQLKKKVDANSPGLTYKTAGARWWNEVVLYAVPVVLGAGLALLMRSDEHFPEQFRGVSPAIMYGMVSGFISGMLFKIGKRVLSRRSGIPLEELETPTDPPAPPGG